MSHWTLEQRVHGFTHIVTVAPSMQLKVCCDWFTVFEMNRFLWDFCIFNIIYMTNECFPKVSHHSIGLQVELILTAEDLLRLIGIHRRFISGRKTVEPNYKAWFQNERDEIEVQDDPDFCLDGCFWYIISFFWGYQELKHQLLGGGNYATLENLQGALNSQLVRWTWHCLVWSYLRWNLNVSLLTLGNKLLKIETNSSACWPENNSLRGHKLT